jgi:hypothetical protein
VSFYTGTQNEVLFSNFTASTNLATFTTEDNLQKTYPPVIIPAGFFGGDGKASGKSLRILSRGQLGTTSAPTFTWTVRLLTSTTWSAGGVVVGTTGAVTAGSTVTLAPWTLDMTIGLRTLGIGAASTVVHMGDVRGATALASPFIATIPAANGTFSVATVDNSTQYYLFISAACSASSASNLINMQQLIVYGEN